MRKILIILLIILLCYFGYVAFSKGMVVAGTQIISYGDVQNSYNQLDKIIENINTKSTVEFENKKKTLSGDFKKLTELKQTYEEKIYSSMSFNSNKVKDIFVYDIDFLWARIGTHATEDKVDIDLDIAENSSGTTQIGNYSLCDFYFTVRGEYVDITTFIYHLEDDEELEFSIEEFQLIPTDKTLTATFKVPEMPLNKNDLIEITNSSSVNTQTDNTVTSTNTTSNTNTNTNTNTTSNTTSNTTDNKNNTVTTNTTKN